MTQRTEQYEGHHVVCSYGYQLKFESVTIEDTRTIQSMAGLDYDEALNEVAGFFDVRQNVSNAGVLNHKISVLQDVARYKNKIDQQ